MVTKWGSNIFPYPLPETRGIGKQDPLDIKKENGEVVYRPGWWREIGKKEDEQESG